MANSTDNENRVCFLLSVAEPQPFKKTLPSYTVEKLQQLMRDWPNPGPDPGSKSADVLLASAVYQLISVFHEARFRDPLMEQASKVLGLILESKLD